MSRWPNTLFLRANNRDRLLAVTAMLLLAGLPRCNCDIAETVPKKPTVAPVQSPTAAHSQVLRGTKQSSTGITINGKVVVEVDNKSDWSSSVDLSEGSNAFSVKAIDSADRKSKAVKVTIVADHTPPAEPTVVAPETVFTATAEISGGREASSAIWINGAEVVPLEESTAWSGQVALEMGTNVLRVTAQDAVGNESPVVTAFVVRGDAQFAVDAVTSPSNVNPHTFTGTRGEGIAVFVGLNGAAPIEAVAAGSAGTWSTQVTLEEGDNTLNFEGRTSGAAPIAQQVQISLDTTPPNPPVLDALESLYTQPDIVLRGTKDANASVVINGTERLGNTSVTVIPGIAFTLELGLNELEVRSADELGNLSDPITPPPTTYYDPNGVVVIFEPAPPAEVDGADVTIGGTRGSGVEITITVNGILVATVPAGTTDWEVTVPLEEGDNEVIVEGTVGDASNSQTVTVTSYPNAPAAPVINAPTVTALTSLSIDGSKPAGTSIERSSSAQGPFTEVVAADAETTFGDTVLLDEGSNTYYYRCRDQFGRVSAVVAVTIVMDPDAASGSISYPLAGAVIGQSVTVVGQATDPSGIDRVRVRVGGGTYAEATGTSSFVATVDTTALAANLDGTMVNIEVEVTDGAQNVAVAAAVSVYLLRSPLAVSGEAVFGNSYMADAQFVDDRAFYAVFSDNSQEGDFDVYLAIQDGQAFVPNHLKLSDNDIQYGTSTWPRVTADSGGLVHLVWLDDGPLGGSQSSPGLVTRVWNGTTLGAAQVIQSGDVESVAYPDIAAGPADTLAAVWGRGGGIELALHNGVSWGSNHIHVNDAVAGVSQEAVRPRVAFSDDGTVHIVWMDMGNLDGDTEADFDVYYRRYSSGTLSDLVLLTTADPDFVDGESQFPAIAAVADDPVHLCYVAWVETGAIGGAGDGVAKVVVRAIDDGALNPLPALGAILEISDQAGHAGAYGVDIAVDDGGNFSVAYSALGDVMSSGADLDVFVRRYNGALEVTPQLLSANSPENGDPNPVVGIDNLNNTHVLWAEPGLTGTGADIDVVYMAIGQDAP